MLIYDCYSTGDKIGFIEVIKDSLTVFKIQREGGFRDQYQISASRLFKWITDNNPDEKLAFVWTSSQDDVSMVTGTSYLYFKGLTRRSTHSLDPVLVSA